MHFSQKFHKFVVVNLRGSTEFSRYERDYKNKDQSEPKGHKRLYSRPRGPRDYTGTGLKRTDGINSSIKNTFGSVYYAKSLRLFVRKY
jgi:hypothetical protein